MTRKLNIDKRYSDTKEGRPAGNSEQKNIVSNSKDSVSVIVNTDTNKSENLIEQELLESKEISFDGYIFKYGYEKYDEDKFGFSNPGFIEVWRDGSLIFKDSFKGEGEVYIKSLGHHELSGKKLIFTLNWGTEACDYHQHSRYYAITSENRVQYLNEYWSGSGGDGYASRYYQHIFPQDTLGIANCLLIVEGMIFHEHDQPNLSDTTRIFFDLEKIKIDKPTNNMDRVQ